MANCSVNEDGEVLGVDPTKLVMVEFARRGSERSWVWLAEDSQNRYRAGIECSRGGKELTCGLDLALERSGKIVGAQERVGAGHLEQEVHPRLACPFLFLGLSAEGQ